MMLYTTKLPRSRRLERVFVPQAAKTGRLSYMWEESLDAAFSVKMPDVDERLASSHVSRASGSTDRDPFAHRCTLHNFKGQNTVIENKAFIVLTTMYA